MIITGSFKLRNCEATIKYIGEVPGKPGGPYLGLELDVLITSLKINFNRNPKEKWMELWEESNSLIANQGMELY